MMVSRDERDQLLCGFRNYLSGRISSREFAESFLFRLLLAEDESVRELAREFDERLAGVDVVFDAATMLDAENRRELERILLFLMDREEMGDWPPQFDRGVFGFAMFSLIIGAGFLRVAYLSHGAAAVASLLLALVLGVPSAAWLLAHLRHGTIGGEALADRYRHLWPYQDEEALENSRREFGGLLAEFLEPRRGASP